MPGQSGAQSKGSGQRIDLAGQLEKPGRGGARKSRVAIFSQTSRKLRHVLERLAPLRFFDPPLDQERDRHRGEPSERNPEAIDLAQSGNGQRDDHKPRQADQERGPASRSSQSSRTGIHLRHDRELE
jgi:hypothetical protein